jgi:hypothetical protein
MEQTYYHWKAKYGGMESGVAKKLKQLDEGRGEVQILVHGVLQNAMAWSCLDLGGPETDGMTLRDISKC